MATSRLSDTDILMVHDVSQWLLHAKDALKKANVYPLDRLGCLRHVKAALIQIEEAQRSLNHFLMDDLTRP